MSSRTLEHACDERRWVVVEVEDRSQPERAVRLRELGFVPGERVQLLRRGFFGGDPLMVRVGASVFALRGEEAACVRIAELP